MYSIPNDAYFSGDGANKTGGKQLKFKKRAPSRKQLENEAKAAADAQEEITEEEVVELGIDGKPKHAYYNETLEIKTKAIQDEFMELYE